MATEWPPAYGPLLPRLVDEACQQTLLRLNDLDEKLQMVILNYFEALLTGAQEEVPQAVRSAALLWGAGGDALSVPSMGRVALVRALAENGAAAHAAEIDDVHADVTGYHPGATILPAVIAIAEHLGSHGLDVMRAIVCGYEIGGRIGAAISPGHRYRGFHATGTVGPLGAAAAVAHLLGLEREPFARALAIATSMASGTFAFLAGAPELKALHAAHAAVAGTWAALAAQAGLDAPVAALEAEEGFFRAFADEVDFGRLFPGPGVSPELSRVLFKPYPCCAHAAGAIDASLRISRRCPSGIPMRQVRSIRIATYRAAAVLGRLDVKRPQQARFSIPYCVLTALLNGHVSSASFSSGRPEYDLLADLSDRIRIEEDPSATAAFPRERRTSVTIVLADGRSESEQTTCPLGSPENPIGLADMDNRLRAAARERLPDRSVATLIRLVRSLRSTPVWAREVAAQLAPAANTARGAAHG